MRPVLGLRGIGGSRDVDLERPGLTCGVGTGDVGLGGVRPGLD